MHVLYAGERGVSARGDQLLSQDTPGMQDAGYEGYLGAALASADFDRDGYADLAIDAPGDPTFAVGVVHVLYGTATGLSTARDQLWGEGADGIGGERDAARFGEAMAAGDFDGDGFADLAIGAPNETVNGSYRAGEVHVIHGSAQGLTSTDAQTWNQDAPGVPNAAEAVSNSQWENFGAGLATGDVDNDGYAELMVGVPGETVHGSCTDSGNCAARTQSVRARCTCCSAVPPG